MIATMAINQPRHDEKHRTTLIVVPAALLQQVSRPCLMVLPFNLLQWQDEITEHTNALFEAHIHHGKDKLKVSHIP